MPSIAPAGTVNAGCDARGVGEEGGGVEALLDPLGRGEGRRMAVYHYLPHGQPNQESPQRDRGGSRHFFAPAAANSSSASRTCWRNRGRSKRAAWARRAAGSK